MNATQTTRKQRHRIQVDVRFGSSRGQESQGVGADRARQISAEEQRSADRIKFVMKTVAASELRPGDIVIHHGERHPIVHVDRGAGWAWPVASDGAGWAMALGDVVAIMDHAA